MYVVPPELLLHFLTLLAEAADFARAAIKSVSCTSCRMHECVGAHSRCRRSTALHCTDCTPLPFTPHHRSCPLASTPLSIPSTPLHANPIHTPTHSTPTHSMPLHFIALPFTPLHPTPLPSTLHTASHHSPPLPARLYSTPLHSAPPLRATPCHAMPLLSTPLHCTRALHCTALHWCTPLHSTLLHADVCGGLGLAGPPLVSCFCFTPPHPQLPTAWTPQLTRSKADPPVVRRGLGRGGGREAPLGPDWSGWVPEP